MSILSNIRLGLLHVAVAISFVAINGVLNRIMIHDLGILSTIVALLVIVPYVLSPMQIWLGHYSDHHPVWGYHRTPYIAVGMLMCFTGMVITPHAALLLAENFAAGVALGLVGFGLWGIGYNLAVVSYLALATDLSTETQRSRTIAVMWFMMIASIIVTAIVLGRALEPYSNAQLFKVFYMAAGVAMLLVVVGLVGLEPRHDANRKAAGTRHSPREMVSTIINIPQARTFFIYLMLLLVAILGQDILLEPFGAYAFDMTVEDTTQLTAMWGGMTLLSLLFYGFVLNRFMTKKEGAMAGGLIAIVGLLMIASSGLLMAESLFRPGIAILGLGTGIATATNLGLMLDMTTPAQTGLFLGAWGVADALSRGMGMLLGGVVRDVITAFSGNVISGYVSVFFIEAMFLVVSLMLLRQLDVSRFYANRRQGVIEMAAMAAD
jgi:BCD family chlorophyll transporter-like MFS transporter